MLESMRVLTKIDSNALARYCRTWSRWRKCEAFIEKNGVSYPLRDPDGKIRYLQTWPEVSICNKLAQQLTRLEQEFGLTPSARSRIQVSNPEPVAIDPKVAKFFLSHLRVAR